MAHTPEHSPDEPFTRAMLVRAVVKALCLFVVFNLAYSALQPVDQGRLPTLYNRVFSGRLRFMKGYEYDPYRLVSDHIIAQAQPDTFNIVFLGSSEIWGSRTGPAESVPADMGSIGLVAADGRPVRVFNLAYPAPYAFKDLVILQAVVEQHIPVDLVIASTFDATLSLQHAPSPVSSANLAFERWVINHYRLPAKYFDQASVTIYHYGPAFLPQWNDRNALNAWAAMQMRGLLWTLVYDDADTLSIGLRDTIPALTQFQEPLTLERVHPEADMLAAFAQFQAETGIPVLILAAPVPVESSAFAPWLREQTQTAGLPLLDCWNVFRDPANFEDYFHITRDMHEVYAHILAKHLGNAAFSADIPGLPLRLPPDFVPPEESCTPYPVQPGEQAP